MRLNPGHLRLRAGPERTIERYRGVDLQLKPTREEAKYAVHRIRRPSSGEIVRIVRFDGWQSTHAGEREVRNALRKTLFKYKLHQDQELFDRAYGYIRTYY